MRDDEGNVYEDRGVVYVSDADLIVSRHAGAIAWLKGFGYVDTEVPVFAEVLPRDVAGKVVVGNIPLHLACVARSVVAIEFTGAAPRGAEFSRDDMIAAGARLVRYTVRVEE